jgi:tetratricopeptide (TPR) repeat protein
MDRGMDGPAVLAEQLLALIAEECAAHPVILVVDDLQWADQASLGLLGRLAGSARDLPLLLVGLMRPVPQRDDLLALRRAAGHAVRLPLAGLDGPAVAELVAALAGGRPDPQFLSLAGGAAGNPLYITELVETMARSSRVTITGDGMAALTPGPVPPSLAGAIDARLGFLSGAAREALRTASLLGVEFAVTDLAVALDSSAAALAGILREACAAGVLAESGLRLRFRHPLIRAALYEEMPASLRAARHREAGRALAAAGVPADRVARQLLSAATEPDGPPEPMEEWALDWICGAAEILVSQAPPVAAALLTRAVGSLPSNSPRYARLASRLANALYHVGDKAAAGELAGRILEHAADPDLLVDLHWTLALCRIASGKPAGSLAALDRALAAPGFLPRQRARLLALAARTHANFGELEKADDTAASALAAAEDNDTWAAGWATHVRAVVAVHRGQLAEALSLHDRGLAVTRADPALADLWLLLHIGKAAALGNLDRHEEALATAEQALRLARQVGTTIRLAQAHSIRGQLLFETGRWDEALAEMTTVPETVKEPAQVCDELGIAALISFHRGDPATARSYLTAAAPHASRLGRRRLIPTLALARSLDHERAGALPEALATLTGWLNGTTEERGSAHDLIADATRLAMHAGDLGTARALAARAAEDAAGPPTPYRQANALYCKGLLDHEAPALLRAADHYCDARRPLQHAKALEAAASEHAHADDREAAQSALSSATKIYASLGATADADAATAAAERNGTEPGPQPALSSEPARTSSSHVHN